MAYRVIAVDDSPSSLKAVEIALPAPEFEVATFGDGLAAIHALPEIEPDAVIAGLSLPSRDGYEVAGYAKSQPNGRQIAVFFIRGVFEPMDMRKISRVDHDGIIPKPFDGETLVGLVRAAVDRRKELPSLPEEPVLENAPAPEPAAAGPAPAEVSPVGEGQEALESRIRDIVAREIRGCRSEIEFMTREIVAAEFKRMLVEELKNIDTRKF